MIIESASVGMTSNRKYSSISQIHKAEMVVGRFEEKQPELDKNSKKDAVTQLNEQKKKVKDEKDAQVKENLKENFNKIQNNDEMGIQGLKPTSEIGCQSPGEISSPEDIKNDIIKMILALMEKFTKTDKGQDYSCKSTSPKAMNSFNASSMLESYGKQYSSGNMGSIVNMKDSSKKSLRNTLWTKVTARSEFFAEVENTKYSTAGVARTADGREINFGVSFEMSRGFAAKYESFSKADYICMDPLVINVGAEVASVSDQKFLFDLDGDGKEESISFTGKGSGFLALDKNGDGKINDGKELFGTKSGDGFKDLATYDKDKNGWIDEKDEVFQKLKVWTKDENGQDKLMSLKEAGVGAIFLGNTDTEFHLNNNKDNHTNGIIRKTGVFLKENGEAGTIQHVDLAI